MKNKEYNGNELAAMLYGRKKKRVKKVEKVKKPKHWRTDYDKQK